MSQGIGVPLALDGFQQKDPNIRRMFTFDTETLDTYWKTDQASTTDPVILDNQENGVVELVTAATALDRSVMASQRAYRVDRGGILVMYRVALQTNIASKRVFFGISDDNAADEDPFALDGSDVLTATAGDAVGFLYDSGAATAQWRTCAVKATVVPDGLGFTGSATLQDGTTLAPVAGTFQNLAIHIDAEGTAVFFINDIQIGGKVENAVTESTLMCLRAQIATLNSDARGAIMEKAGLAYVTNE
jgi:hypothetical protein